MPEHGTVERWLEEHGDCLYRYALFRVKQPDVAEDLLQETFLAAIKRKESFEGKSQVRTWLVGILRNKIFDHFRKIGREQTFSDLRYREDADEEMFDENGGWKPEVAPKPWDAGERVEALDRPEFWRVMTGCLDKIPKRVGDVFMLREMEECSTEEICRSLSVTPNNLWVMLHRARASLRQCMEMNWFEQERGV